jgi:hypothetical protein
MQCVFGHGYAEFAAVGGQHRDARPPRGSGRVNDDVEALAGSRRNEITREQIVLRFAYLEGVLAAGISLPQPLSADRVRNVEEMQLVGDGSLSNQRTIQRRLPTVFAGKSRTMDRPCRRISTMCGPMASRAEKRV